MEQEREEDKATMGRLCFEDAENDREGRRALGAHDEQGQFDFNKDEW